MTFAAKKQVEIVELHDIEKDYMLVHSRLLLLHKLPDPAHTCFATPTPQQTVGLLVNAGMYDSAISTCKMFSLPLNAVFESLAAR